MPESEVITATVLRQKLSDLIAAALSGGQLYAEDVQNELRFHSGMLEAAAMLHPKPKS